MITDSNGKVDVEINGDKIQKNKNVKTGDNTSVIEWSALTIVSLMMCVLLFVYKKKENK